MCMQSFRKNKNIDAATKAQYMDPFKKVSINTFSNPNILDINQTIRATEIETMPTEKIYL